MAKKSAKAKDLHPAAKITPPAVTDYIERIGATPISFRSWQVTEWKGKYYFEKAYIRINSDGTVVAPKDFMPTKDEQEKIKKAWQEADLPKSVPARNTNGIKLQNSDSILYTFYNKEGLIIFAQERTEPKGYLPWSYWDDGQWRQMQPEGKIPFYKPKSPKPGASIMIHEGAKAAHAAQNLPKDHPWYDELSKYEHWGICGGALAVNRADYEDLRNRRSEDTIYVCDNDHPGRSMLPWVSKNYGSRLTGVIVGSNFKDGWDMADPLPEDYFNRKTGLYIGPKIGRFKKQATYATETIHPEDPKAKPFTVIRRAFAEEWFNIVTPEAFIHRDYPNQMFTKKEFDNFIAPFSGTPETSKLLVRDEGGKGLAIGYHPGKKTGLFHGKEGGTYINTHRPSPIEPLKSITKKDIAPFIEFLEHLFPVEHDRREAMRWCATIIARPEVKMHYGILLISETQGVGKGTLGEKILAPLVGTDNTSFPGEKEITESAYNYWIAHKRLAVVHEIYAGHSSRAYNDLKSTITDMNITVKRKYMADYTITNWLHAFACSNSPRALKLSMDDRRWLVPKVREAKRPEGYWAAFHEWLQAEQGLEKIAAWARDFGDYVKTGQDAPWTSVKKDIIEESFSEGQKLVHNVLASIKETAKEPVIISDLALVELIRDVIHEGRANADRLEKPNTVRAIAKGCGYFIGEDRVKAKEFKSVINPIRLIASEAADLECPGKDLAAKGRKLFDVKAFWEANGRKL
jgi:Family of unknown function (DUF5906)